MNFEKVNFETKLIFGAKIQFLLFSDETWKTLRKYLSPTFTPKKVKFMVEPIEKISKNFTDFLLEQEKNELDLKPKLFHFAIDVICKAQCLKIT